MDTNAGTGSIWSITPIETDSFSSPTGGIYCVSLRGASAEDLAAYWFEPEGMDEESSLGFFRFELPRPAGCSNVCLLRGATVLATVQASVHPPTVQMNHPNGGEMFSNDLVTATWTASDEDADSLSFTLTFSPDGGATWQLVQPWLSTTNTVVDCSTLQAATNGLFRVEANDGFLAAQDQSDQPFGVLDHSPIIQIMTPSNNVTLAHPWPITFEAMAYDPDVGLLTGDNVSWLSDGSAVIGTGAVVQVLPSTLGEGTHTVTATIMDGATPISQSVSLHVVLDQDLDGMPDSWESACLGSDLAAAEEDPDGDGACNGDEYTADTDPTNVASVLRLDGLSSTNGVVYLSWQGGTGAWQCVEHSTAPGATSTTWQAVFTNAPPTSESPSCETPATNAAGVYRVRAYR